MFYHMCRCQDTDLIQALDEQPLECLKCLGAAAYEASSQFFVVSILCLPLYAGKCQTAWALERWHDCSVAVLQALCGANKARIHEVLGRHLPRAAVYVRIFNHKASLLSIAMIKSSCIGAPPSDLTIS